MRKFLIIGIGIFLLSGTVIFTSDAENNCNCNCLVKKVDPKSRYISQGCCKDLTRKIRPFSNRIGPWRYRKTRTKCKNCNTYQKRHTSGREDVYLYSQYRKSRLSRKQQLAYQRQVFGEDHGGRLSNTQVSNKNIVRGNDFVYKSGQQVENKVTYKTPQNFAVSLPSSFIFKDGIYRSKNSSLAFRVVSGGKCNSIGFSDCAKRLDSRLKKENKVYNVFAEQTFYRWNQTILSDFDYFQTIVKSFNATSNGKYNSYFTFTALDPTTNEVLRIEAVSLASEKNQVAQQINSIFESFRFKI